MATKLDYFVQVRGETPTGEAAVFPTFGAPMRSLTTVIDRNGKDIAYRYLNDNASIAALLAMPTAIEPGPVEIPRQGVKARLLLQKTGSVDMTAVELDSAEAGLIVDRYNYGDLQLDISDAWRAGYADGSPISRQAVFKAPHIWDRTQFLQWTVTVNTTGTLVVVNPAPQVVSQPQAQSFAEGSTGTFFVPTESLFSDTDALTYAFTKDDGSALPAQWSVAAFANGGNVVTYNLSAPYVATTRVRIRATDTAAQTADVFVNWVSTDVPNPVVLQNPPSLSIADDQGSTFDIDLDATFDNATTYDLKLDDGSALPTGWSANVVSTTMTVTYPAESVARSFRLRGTNAASEFKDAFFVVNRPAAPNIIGTADPVYFQEASSGSVQVDIAAIIASVDSWHVELSTGAALPSQQFPSVNVNGSGLATISYQFADNEILSFNVRYRGVKAGFPDTIVSTTYASRHNPPNLNAQTISALNDSNFILQAVQLSDDPANNLVVAGSVAPSLGQAVLSADKKQITVTQPTGYVGNLDVTYTLEAGGDSAARTTGTQTINFSDPIAPSNNAPMNFSAVDGQDFAAVNLLSYFSAGTYSLDAASLRFVDLATGDIIGSNMTIAGVGTFSINSAGDYDYVGTSGYIGTQQVYVSIADIKGNRSDPAPLGQAQTTASTPGAPFPNTLDGKPILGLGLNHFRSNSGEFPFWNEWAMLDHFQMSLVLQDGSVLSSREMIEQGLFDPYTGRIQMPANSTWTSPRVRYLQTVGHPTMLTGEWSIKFRFTGTVAMSNPGGIGFSENGSTGSYKRYTRTLGSSDTGSINAVISAGASGGDFYPDWCGLSAYDAGARNEWRTDFVDYIKGYKVFRTMDWDESDFAEVFYADEMMSADSYFIYGESSKWGPMTANRFKRQGGFDPKLAYSLAATTGRSRYANTPMTLGFGSVESEYLALSIGASPAGGNAALDAAVAANIATIEADIYQQNYILAQRWYQAMIDAGVPDYLEMAVEPGLEQWNTGKGRQYALAVSLARAKGINSGALAPWGAGYYHVIFTRAWRDARALVKPAQRMAFCCGVQGPNINTGQRAIQAWQFYASANPSVAPPISELALAPAFYISGVHGFKSGWGASGNPFGATTESEFNAAYQAEDQAGTLFATALAWSQAQFTNKPTFLNGRSPWAQILLARQWQSLAVNNGCRFYGGYEGGNGDSPNYGASGLRAVYPASVARSRDWTRSAEGYTYLKQFLDQWFLEFPDAVCMNYFEVESTGGGLQTPWSEKTPLEMNVLVPDTMSAAWDELKTTAPAGGGGGGGGGSYTEIDKDFTNADTRSTLSAEGWSYVGSGHAVAADGDGDYLRSGTELDEAKVTIRPSSPANANLSLEVDFKVEGTANLNYASFFLASNNTGAKVNVNVISGGNMTITAPNDKNTVLVTTSGRNFADGNLHQILIEYYIHASSGYVRVKDRNTLAVLGTFSGNTNPLSVANLNLDAFILRGRRKLYRIKGVTP